MIQIQAQMKGVCFFPMQTKRKKKEKSQIFFSGVKFARFLPLQTFFLSILSLSLTHLFLSLFGCVFCSTFSQSETEFEGYSAPVSLLFFSCV
uniref:Uncharacterized protein n=1 Tax=Glycine max TaxID=3847 RepID=C6TLH5_SOYBN|nr:unknown [Glycine max]